MKLLQELNRDGLTILLVTHETDIAAYASRRLVIKDGRVRTDEMQTPRAASADLAVWRDEQ